MEILENRVGGNLRKLVENGRVKKPCGFGKSSEIFTIA